MNNEIALPLSFFRSTVLPSADCFVIRLGSVCCQRQDLVAWRHAGAGSSRLSTQGI